MPKAFLTLVLLTATTSLAAAQSFLLGIDYSVRIPNRLDQMSASITPLSMGTDSSGYVYVLVGGFSSETGMTPLLMKLSPAGDTVYWSLVDPSASAIAVDPAGNVYLAGGNFVEKWNTDGKTPMYKTTISANASIAGIAVDAAGRAYATGWTTAPDLATTPGAAQQTSPVAGHGFRAFALRLKTDGTFDYATYLGGGSQARPAAIAMDASASAYVLGNTVSAGFPTTPGAYLTASGIPNNMLPSFLTRLSPDGSSIIYSTFTDKNGFQPCCLVVDAAGNAVAGLVSNPSTSELLRFNPQGTAVLFSTAIPASAPRNLALDSAGNIYAVLAAGIPIGGGGTEGAANFPVKNSLATCDPNASLALAALDANGNILQATYIPGSELSTAAVVSGANSSAYVLAAPTQSYTPTSEPSESAGGLWFLAHFVQSPAAQVVSLACEGNSASYASAAVSPGEIVSLFGNGLGPAVGAQPQVDAQSGFPKQLAGVQVTFNGIPAPLLYVQDAQINAIAPWSLQSGDTAQICVVYDAAPTNCLSRPVLDAHPGVFTEDGTYAVAFSLDGTRNSASNPAQVGSIVSLYATGLGPIHPAQPDGSIIELPLPADVLSTQLDWQIPTGIGPEIFGSEPAEYAGPAPFAVAGFSQINMVVPDTYACAFGCGWAPLILQVGSTGFSNYFLVQVAGH